MASQQFLFSSCLCPAWGSLTFQTLLGLLCWSYQLWGAETRAGGTKWRQTVSTAATSLPWGVSSPFFIFPIQGCFPLLTTRTGWVLGLTASFTHSMHKWERERERGENKSQLYFPLSDRPGYASLSPFPLKCVYFEGSLFVQNTLREYLLLLQNNLHLFRLFKPPEVKNRKL